MSVVNLMPDRIVSLLNLLAIHARGESHSGRRYMRLRASMQTPFSLLPNRDCRPAGRRWVRYWLLILDHPEQRSTLRCRVSRGAPERLTTLRFGSKEALRSGA